MKPVVPDQRLLKKFGEREDRLKGLVSKLDRQFRLDPLVEKTIKQSKRSVSMMSRTVMESSVLMKFNARNNSEMERTVESKRSNQPSDLDYANIIVPKEKLKPFLPNNTHQSREQFNDYTDVPDKPIFKADSETYTPIARIGSTQGDRSIEYE